MTALENPIQAVTNRLELRFVALQRSGHHAILHWIMANMDGRYVFINNCRPGKSPFASINSEPNRNKLVTNIPDFDVTAEQAGNRCRKDYLLYNYEDHVLRDIEADDFYVNHDAWLGTSQRTVNVLILRDPYNMIASRLRMEDYRRSLQAVPHSVRQLPVHEIRRFFSKPTRLIRKVVKRIRPAGWKKRDALEEAARSRDLFMMYAREFLNETNILQNKLTINYNRWFIDGLYRVELARRIGLASADRGLDRVARWGSGSSFDRNAFDGRAREMGVLTRWKAVIDDERYRALIDDAELHELSERIFGQVIERKTLESL